jgi:hypothetical protein
VNIDQDFKPFSVKLKRLRQARSLPFNKPLGSQDHEVLYLSLVDVYLTACMVVQGHLCVGMRFFEVHVLLDLFYAAVGLSTF